MAAQQPLASGGTQPTRSGISRVAKHEQRRPTEKAKHSLLFILGASSSHEATAVAHTPSIQCTAIVKSTDAVAAAATAQPIITKIKAEETKPRQRKATAATRSKARQRRPTRSDEERRRARECTIDGCANYTINKGRCFRHGGGKKCTVNDCDASAKVSGRCWKHGGSVQCSVPDCDRRGKSRGLCWAHGGGTLCETHGCSKVAVSNKFCWAHGGGKRCLFGGCQRPAYERTLNYCPRHFKLFEQGQEVLEV